MLRSTITEKIADGVKGGQIKHVAAVNDASDRKHEIRIEVDLKRDAPEEVVMNQLFQYTALQSNYHINNIALVGGQPRTLTLIDLLERYLDHRKDVVRRRTNYLLRRAKQPANLLEGLILAVGDIDEIIELIKKSPNPATAKERLLARPLRLLENATLERLLPKSFVSRVTAADVHLTAVQAGAILSMQLQKLTGLEIEKLAGDYTKLVEEIEGHEAILRNERLLFDIIREDLHELKSKFSNKRRTEICDAVGEFSMEELIPDDPVVVTLPHEGYIKRTDVDSYRKQGRGGKGVRGGTTKEGDFLEHLFAVSTHDHLLVFTNRGRVYWLRVYDLPSMSRTSRGRSLANLVRMQPGESPRAVLPVQHFEDDYIFFATARGTGKKTPIAAFSRPRANGIRALTFVAADELGGSGFIAAFVGGLIFGRIVLASYPDIADFAEDLVEILVMVAFMIFGGLLLQPRLGDFTWEMLLYALLSLTLVRMLPVAISMIGKHLRLPTVLYMGWFGPRGLASLIFAAVVIEEVDIPETDFMVTVVTLTVALSILLHGITAYLGSNAYADWYEHQEEDHDQMHESKDDHSTPRRRRISRG